MNGAPLPQLVEALTSAQYVEQPTGAAGAHVWVPRTASTTPGPGAGASVPPAAAPLTRQAPPAPAADRTEPAPAPAQGGALVVSAGPPGREFSAPTGLQHQAPVARSFALTRKNAVSSEKEELPDGVLARISNEMAAAITLVAGMGMAEAAYNLGRGVYTLLQLPLPLAIGFPAIFEVTAATFAIQDMRDRRQGHASRAMRVATNLTLLVSAAVNGVVGYAGAGLAGLVEILPPLIIAAVIHLHGERATRAYHSQAVLRPTWRKAQLNAARRASVLDVLPLLAGDDVHGKATVASLTHLMESGNLEPDQALIAAGWHDRHLRLNEASPGQAASMLRRLETIAATVWGHDGPPADTRVSAPAPSHGTSLPRSRTTSSTPPGTPSTATSGTPSTTTSGTPSTTTSGTPSTTTSGTPSTGDAAEAPRKADDATLAQLVAEARAQRPSAGEGSVRALLTARHLSASAQRIREALAAHTAAGATPPTLRVLHPDTQAAGTAEGGAR